MMVLVGQPGCGKSTFVEKYMGPNDDLIGTDKHIDRIAAQNKITYREAFDRDYPKAEKLMEKDIKDLLEKKKKLGRINNHVFVDRTNLMVNSRKPWISLV